MATPRRSGFQLICGWTASGNCTYDALVNWGERADIEYVRVLHLAASTMQGPVERVLLELLSDGQRFDYAAVKALAAPEPVVIPVVKIGKIDLTRLDVLLTVAL